MDSAQRAARGRAIAALARGFAGAAELSAAHLSRAEQVVEAILFAAEPGHTEHAAAVQEIQEHCLDRTPDPRD